jgi:hypothetical protein
MSTQFFIGPKSDGKPLGSTYYGGINKSKMFGFVPFVPIDEQLQDLRMIQPGDAGYGRANVAILEFDTAT